MANDFKEQLQNILPLEVVPLKSGHLATQLVFAYVMFLKGEVAAMRLLRFMATRLPGYMATYPCHSFLFWHAHGLFQHMD